MSLSLEDKDILISGSTDGLGRLTALSLAKLGANVIVHGRDSNKVDAVVSELKDINGKGNFSGITCDLNKPASVEDAFKNVNDLDALINNAGVWLEGATIDSTPEKIIELVNVNLMSYLLLSRLMLPKLLNAKFGQLLNVISVAGYEVPSDYFHTFYSATKYGLQGFSEALAKEFDGKNVRVMGFYPGGMSTTIFKKAGIDYKVKEPWMFDPEESVEAITFMLTRNPKVSVKRMDLINHLFE